LAQDEKPERAGEIALSQNVSHCAKKPSSVKAMSIAQALLPEVVPPFRRDSSPGF
jgi:hypothetical protein